MAGSLKGIWATLRTRVSPVTLTVTPTLLFSRLGLALPSKTTLLSPFPGMTKNLSTASVWWTLWPKWPLRSKRPWTISPSRSRRGRERLSATGEPLPQLDLLTH